MSESFSSTSRGCSRSASMGEPGHRLFFLQAHGDGIDGVDQVREAAGRRRSPTSWPTILADLPPADEQRASHR